jgi:capsular polysaccharide biosynthesis protein
MMEDGNDGPRVKIQSPVAPKSMRLLVICLVAAILVMILIAALTLH